MSETEWSQHKKLIDFSERKGGFRRSMVPNLPYFMVQFDYKGEKGYGHVIEGTSEAADEGDPDGAIDEGAKGSGEFPRSVSFILHRTSLTDSCDSGTLPLRSSATSWTSSRASGGDRGKSTSGSTRTGWRSLESSMTSMTGQT